MKNLFLTIVVFSVLLLIGCQENSITDPVQQELQKTDDPSILRGTILLEGILEVPNLPNSYLSINGQVGYVHRIELLDPISTATQHNVSLSLQVNAGLSDPYSERHPYWLISSKSQDIIYVSEDGIYQFVTSFPIQDRSDGMVLVCSFLVTTEGVSLSAMWLAAQEDTFNKTIELDPPVSLPPVLINKPISH
jgi:hypothetical protein